MNGEAREPVINDPDLCKDTFVRPNGVQFKLVTAFYP